MRTIRTTMRPDVEIEVPEKEYTDLSRQGLVAGMVGDPERDLTPDSLADAAKNVNLDDSTPTPSDAPAPTKKNRN